MKDGGPMFPQMVSLDRGTIYDGMSLRDYFAGQALATIISLTQNRDGGWDPIAVAVGAYAVADAMLAQRIPQATEHPHG